MCGGLCGKSGDGCTQPCGRSLVSVGESARLTSYKSAVSASQPPDSDQPRNGNRNYEGKRCVPAHQGRPHHHLIEDPDNGRPSELSRLCETRGGSLRQFA